MKYRQLISALAIITAIAIAPATGAFAQSDDASDEVNDKKIYKEERKQFLDSVKEQRKALTDQIRDFKDQRKDQLGDSDKIRDVEPSLEFKGETSGWAVIGGKAYPATFSLDGKAGQVERSWMLSGEGTVVIGDRNVTFDLKGFAKDNHVNIKGISQDDESITIHLRGNFAPIAENEGSFALAFTRAAIVDSNSDVKVPLVLVGEVKTSPITPVDDIEPETTDSVDDLLDDLL